jgi:phosphate transport system protein
MLEKRLKALVEKLFEMADLTRSMLKNSLRALETRNAGLAAKVGDVDELIVNQMETWNLEEAIRVITLFQPMGKNVRQLVAAILINRDLERVADHAQNIADHARHLVGHPDIETPPELLSMGGMALKMLDDGLRSYTEEDEELAKEVIGSDEELNEATKATVRILLGRMSHACREADDGEFEDCRLTEGLWRLALCARNLERVGDHATNIAESVLFVVESHLHLHHKHEIAKELAKAKGGRPKKK